MSRSGLTIQSPSGYSANLPLAGGGVNRKLAESHIKANKTRLLAMWQMAVNGMHPGKL